MRATPSTPGTHRLTAGMSIMKAHTRSGGAGTVMRCSITTWASVYTDSDATPDWSAPQSAIRRTAADDRRHHPPRWQRADDPRVVRVPRWPDLAQRRPETRLGQTYAPRSAGDLVRGRPQEHVPLGPDSGPTCRHEHGRWRRPHRAPLTALHRRPVSQ